MKSVYKMRTITGETTEKSKYSNRIKDCWVLECGHIIEKHKPESLADAFRLITQEFNKRDGKPIKARCYQCCKEQSIKEN
jgi:hypothetical protein